MTNKVKPSSERQQPSEEKLKFWVKLVVVPVLAWAAANAITFFTIVQKLPELNPEFGQAIIIGFSVALTGSTVLLTQKIIQSSITHIIDNWRGSTTSR